MLPVVNDIALDGSGAPALGKSRGRHLPLRYAPVFIIALATLLALPGMHPSQAWILPIVCLVGGLAMFEVRRRLGALLHAYARAHGAVISEADAIVGSSIA
jgi:hypothetical protein